MANLEKKILDGDNVGYCSSSDEEKPQVFVEKDNTASGYCLPSAHKGENTGPKGVLSNYKQYQRNIRNKKRTNRFTVERGVNNQNEEEEEQEDSEDELTKLRRQRYEQLRNKVKGRIIEIPNADEFLSIIEKNYNCYVFIHIYRDGLESATTLNDALLQLAAKFEDRAKFFKVQSSTLGTSGMFTANALPALQVYKNNNLVGSFVRITDVLTEDFDANVLNKFLIDNDIDPLNEG